MSRCQTSLACAFAVAGALLASSCGQTTGRPGESQGRDRPSGTSVENGLRLTVSVPEGPYDGSYPLAVNVELSNSTPKPLAVLLGQLTFSGSVGRGGDGVVRAGPEIGFGPVEDEIVAIAPGTAKARSYYVRHFCMTSHNDSMKLREMLVTVGLLNTDSHLPDRPDAWTGRLACSLPLRLAPLPWGKAANGLQARLDSSRRIYKRGDRMIVKFRMRALAEGVQVRHWKPWRDTYFEVLPGSGASYTLTPPAQEAPRTRHGRKRRGSEKPTGP